MSRWRTGVRQIKAVKSEAPPSLVPPCWWMLGFWRGARRGRPPGSETREQALEQRLGPFRRRDLRKQTTTRKMSSAPRYSDGEKGMRDTHSIMQPHLRWNTSHDRSSHDVCGPPTRCVVRVVHNLMRLGGKRPCTTRHRMKVGNWRRKWDGHRWRGRV